MRLATSVSKFGRLLATVMVGLGLLGGEIAPAVARTHDVPVAETGGARTAMGSQASVPTTTAEVVDPSEPKRSTVAPKPVRLASMTCWTWYSMSQWKYVTDCDFWYKYFNLNIPQVVYYGQDVEISIAPVGSAATFDSGSGDVVVDGQSVFSFTTTAANPAKWSPKGLPAGYHDFTVTGAPDGWTNNNAYQDHYLIISKAPTQTSLSTTTLGADGKVTLWSSLAVVAPGAGTPTGSIAFSDETGTVLATVPLSGNAASATVTLTPGLPHQLIASYTGDGNFAASSWAVDVPVVGLTAGPTTITTKNGATLTATVAGPVSATMGRPTGTITFGDGNTGLGIATLSSFGQASPFALGGAANCALVAGPTKTGGVACLGSNVHGQLGSGTGVDSLAPVAVSGLSSNVVSVAAGFLHACAVTVSGAVSCWGDNASGQLGDGTVGSRNAPSPVVGLGSGAVAVAAGSDHTCALLADGSVRCWGGNGAGQLGNGGTDGSTTPVAVSGLSGPAIGVAASGFHSCAVIRGGAVQCWGQNDAGQLGNGTTAAAVLAPVTVVGLAGPAVQVATGNRHTCALILDATVQCWGDASRGQIGDGALGLRPQPSTVPGPASIVEIAAGNNHTCAVSVFGAMACWGANDHGQLGNGSTGDQATAVTVTALADTVGAIGAGADATCAVGLGSAGTAGRIWCWGDGGAGQSGNGAATAAVTSAIGFDPATPAGFSGWLQSRAGLAIPPTSTGSHSYTAYYTGDSTYTGSTSAPVAVTVTPTPDTLRLSVSNVAPTHGDTLTLTATVAPADATGSVTFLADGVSIGSGTVSGGVVTMTTSTLGGGSHALTATYSGDAIYAAATTSAINVTVAKEATSIILRSSGSALADEPVGLSATISPAAATGTVAFSVDGGSPWTATVSNGSATTYVPGLAAGQHSIVATYSGDGDRLGATSAPVSVTVALRRVGVVLSAAPSPSRLGELIGVEARVVSLDGIGARPPVGAVVFSFDGGATQAVPMFDGSAHTAFSQANTAGVLQPGNHTITASFAGDTSYQSGWQSFTQVITKIPTTTTLTAASSTLLAGHPETLTVSVTPADATGTVDVLDGGTKIGTVTPVAGAATLALDSLSIGTHTLKASYAGDTTHMESDSAPVTVTVAKSPSSTVFSTTKSSGTYGDPLTLAARVVSANPPTGSASFGVGGTTVATAPLGPIGGETGTLTAFNDATCALVSTGVSCWGWTTLAKLGVDPATKMYSGPVSVAGLQSPVAVVGGGDHACAIAGTRHALMCWGSNSMGELGGGTASDYEIAPVTAIASGATAAAAGSFHTCAINGWGAVSCWGSNAKGQLGNGTTVDSASPVAVSGLSSGAVAITAGSFHSCALLRDGSVWCWGAGPALGNGGGADRTTPVAVSGLSGAAVAIVAGATGSHSCALLADATVQCWGNNRYGQLGNGTTTNSTVPVTVSGLAGVVRIAAGASHTCAAANDDTVTCWGSGSQGRLGNGGSTGATTPVAVAAAFGPIAALSAGTGHTCVETSDGTINCWGASGGISATIADDPQTTPLAVPGAPAALIAARAAVTTRSLPVGQDSVIAAWPGDGGSLASADAGRQILIGSATPSVALTASANPASFGTPVTVTATVSSSAATGAVVFSEAGQTLATVALADGVAAYTLTRPSIGTHTIKADYAGDANFDPAPTASLAVVVAQQTSTTVVSGPTGITVGAAATFTATVTPSTATGTVAFFDGARSLGGATLASGAASVTVSGLAIGDHPVTATYSGNATIAASTSAAVTTTVTGQSASLALSGPSSAVFGQAVTLTATVTPTAATGTVTFRDGASVLGTATLVAGRAGLTTSALAVGAHAVTASYGGDATYTAASATAVTVQVAPAATTLALAASKVTILPGASLKLTATVAVSAPGKGTPSDSVTFRDGGTVLGTAALAGGVATLTTVPPSSGVHGFTASFAGSTSFAASSGSASVTVDPRLGTPVQVNTTKAGSQQSPAIATLADGSSVVVWQSDGQDGSGLGVYGQRWSAAGAKVGPEFRVATTTAGAQSQPSVAALKGGSFVVVWQSSGQDGSGLGVYLQRYAANGAALGTETVVPTTKTGDQQAPVIAALGDGGFVVAWQSQPTASAASTIRARRWSAAGVAAGSDFRADTTTTTSQTAPTIAALKGGGFLIAWVSTKTGSGATIRGQAFTASAVKAGGELAISTSTTGSRSQPALAATADGGAVAVWTTTGQTGATRSLFLQRLGAGAAKLGGETRITSQVAGDQTDPSVAGFPGGGFVVAWTAKPGSMPTLRQIRFHGDGTTADVDMPIELGGATALGQSALAVASDKAFAAVFAAAAPVRAAEEVELQRFGLAAPAP